MEEATGEGLLNKIRPPRLEDAGLEDCALPPESIKEAFLKAATAVRSIVVSNSSDDEEEGRCVNDPWPIFGESSDTVVGIEDDVPDGCAAEKGDGGLKDLAGDEVVVVGGPDVSDDGGKACVDGLQGLEIGGKKGSVGEEEEEKDGERPILAEGFV